MWFQKWYLIGYQVVPKLIPRKKAKNIYLLTREKKAQQGNFRIRKTVFKGNAGARNNDKDG